MDQEGREIRVLSLHSSDNIEDDVVRELAVASLPSHPNPLFEAISYC